MLETKVAKRYAKSLIGLASENGSLDAVNADMKFFLSTCEQNRELGVLLRNPIVHTYQKLNVIKNVFGDKLNKVTMSFFEIVTRKGREGNLISIAKEFISQYKVLKGIQTAEIVSAVGLDDTLRQKVYDVVRNSTHSEVELIEKIDKNLIGGFILRVGDKQFDASISSELRKLTQAFSKNTYVVKN
jgi:F-type H+-transporting ATPase subunit delta